MQPALETRGLAFQGMIRYPDLAAPAGEATFLTGPSGSGKSTLLRIFNGTLTPSEGCARYDGRDVAEWDTIALRREVLLAGQSVFLFDADIRENFAQYYAYREQPAPDDGTIKRYLALCCADFPLEKDCATMSGGEKQRVYTALFLSFLPKVLMLDEPTSALDAQTGARMLENVLGFCAARGMTALVVSHDQKLQERFARHTVALEGRG